MACSCASIILPGRHCAAVERDDPQGAPEGVSTREARVSAARGVPLHKLNPNVSQELRDVLDSPSYFRRMPSQQIDCDPQMFTFLVRRPEVMVNIWEVMGITKVKAKRTSSVSFLADDGVGTACKCDLIYSDDNLHIYWGNGTYEGGMAPRKVSGRCVCLLRTEQQAAAAGTASIRGTMDVFLKVDNFGADLLTRTIGPFVGKTADYNFVETSKFISQISQVCETNPSAAQALVMRLDRVDEVTRREFGEIVTRIASNNADREYQSVTLRHAAEAAEELAQSSQQPSTLVSQQRSSLSLDEPSGQRAMARLDIAQSEPLELQWSDGGAQRVPPAVMSQASLKPTSESTQTGSQARSAPVTGVVPTAIAPHKPNIFMRR